MHSKLNDLSFIGFDDHQMARIVKPQLSIVMQPMEEIGETVVFGGLVEELGMVHERIPVKTPNMNARIESFHSILGNECYSRYEFSSFKEAYAAITEYMRYYNERRRHGSIKYMALNKFYEAFMSNVVSIKAFSA